MSLWQYAQENWSTSISRPECVKHHRRISPVVEVDPLLFGWQVYDPGQMNPNSAHCNSNPLSNILWHDSKSPEDYIPVFSMRSFAIYSAQRAQCAGPRTQWTSWTHNFVTSNFRVVCNATNDVPAPYGWVVVIHLELLRNCKLCLCIDHHASKIEF